MVSGHSHMECDIDRGFIEKQKKKLKSTIYHPHDWYQLVRSVKISKKHFQVKELSHSDFLKFDGLLKDSLILRKKDTDGEMFSWLKSHWFCYTKEYGILNFKYNLEETEPFKSLSFVRRGSNPKLVPAKLYKSPLAIPEAKKKDILQLLEHIPDVFHQFYKDLRSSVAVPNIYPDIEEHKDD